MTGHLGGHAEGVPGHQVTGHELLALLQRQPKAVLDRPVAGFNEQGNAAAVLGIFVGEQSRLVRGKDNFFVREDRVLTFTLGDYTPDTYV